MQLTNTSRNHLFLRWRIFLRSRAVIQNLLIRLLCNLFISLFLDEYIIPEGILQSELLFLKSLWNNI